MSSASLRASYQGKRVFVTGHTGFKGAWLCAWLRELGAEVFGYALAPDTSPALFDELGLAKEVHHTLGDVRELPALDDAFAAARPDIVFHLAAQPLVRKSYADPLETIQTNILGTTHLLEVIRRRRSQCAVVIVTSDKCYENREWIYGYREDEAMGGHDIYSMSKGACELVVAAYRRSFFPQAKLAEHGVRLASARAGNVLGGGDWALDRIVPDIVRALSRNETVRVRNPNAVRPWQHVLEPLSGYLVLGSRLLSAEAGDYCEGFNFGPDPTELGYVRDVVQLFVKNWGKGAWEDTHNSAQPHEAGLLRLSIEKAAMRLQWRPRWNLARTIAETARWYRAYDEGLRGAGLVDLTLAQIRDYSSKVDG